MVPSIPFISVSPKQKLEIVSEGKCTILEIDDKPLFFQFEGRWLPLLRLILSGEIRVPYRKVTVDMGAIKFVANGADIMRPGITQIEDGISIGDPVLIIDETHGKTLALGIALFNSEEMRTASGGKVIRNAHAAGDALWELTK
jgi:PUA-domain protein